MDRINAASELSFEQYSAWAISRYPGYREDDASDVVSGEAITMAPESSEACPVTVRSERHGQVIVTPKPKGSR